MEIPRKIQRSNSARKSLSKALYGASNLIRGTKQEFDLATIEAVSVTRYIEGEKEKLLEAVADGKTALTRELLENLVLSPGGFVSREYRSRVWPVLLKVKGKGFEPKEYAPTANIEHEVMTIKNDVARALSHFETTEFDLSGDIEKYRDLLYKMMIRNFHDDQSLHYYQGFHDVASVHMLTCGDEMGVMTLLKHSQTMLKDFHEKTMEPTVAVTELLYVILDKLDRVVAQKLRKAQVKPLFALSWLLTGFAHDLKNFDNVCRLYDAFLSFHPLFPVYTAAALIITPKFRSGLLRLGNDSAEIHHYMQSLPKATEELREKFSYDRLLQAALGIMRAYPPKSIVDKSKQLKIGSVAFAKYPFSWN